MTSYAMDPYEVGNGYVPRPKIKRPFAMPDVVESAAEAGGMLGAARQARRAPEEFVNYEMDLSPYDTGEPNRPLSRESVNGLLGRALGQGQQRAPEEYVNYGPPQPAGNSPFVPTARQRSPYGPESRPPMEMPVASRPAPSFMETTNWSGSAAGDEASRQAEAAARPGANAIFRPRPEVGGRPENIADNVARETIARAAIAQATGDPNAEALMDQAATYAWQREAAVNGNARGDAVAPRDYIESWKGQVRAGGEGSPFADMFGRASAAARQVMAQQQGQQIRSQTPPVINATNAQVGRLTGQRAPSPEPSYGTARGGASSEGQSTTRRLPAPMVDDGLITRVMSGGSRPPQIANIPLDNTSRTSFVKSAYGEALRATGGDEKLARQLLATAISENGNVGSGKDLGADMGFNVGGIQGIEGTAGSFMANDNGNMRKFAKYNNLGEGFQAVLNVIKNPLYAEGWARYQRDGDVDALWDHMNAKGYAEDPEWSKKVSSIRSGQVEPFASAAPQAAPRPTAATAATPANADFSMVERIMANARGGGGTAASAPVQAAQAGVSAQQQTQAAKSGQSVWELGNLTPNQYNVSASEGLDKETADAVCGPAAAIAFARKLGRNPTMTEAVNLAKQVGWTAAAGMAGPASQLKLLQSMGIPASLEDGPPNASKMVASIQAGNPVTASTSGHYFVAEGYDPATGKFNFGNSALVLKRANGNPWYTLEEVGNLGMGSIRGTLYIGAT